MAQLTYSAILAAVKAKKYPPIYFLQGEEPYFIHALVAYMEANVVVQSHQVFNLKRYYGKEIELNMLLEEACSFPLFPSLQLIIIKNAHEMKQLTQKEGEKALLNYIKRPNSQTLLLFAYHNKTLDSRKKLTKELAQQNMLFTSQPLKTDKIPTWIIAKAAEKKRKIEIQAAIALQTMVGDRLPSLDQELDKICANVAPSLSIDLLAIKAYASCQRTYSLWDLQEAILEHCASQMTTIIHYLVHNQHLMPFPKLIAFLYHLYSNLLMLQGANTSSSLPIHPYLLRKYKKAILYYPTHKLHTIIIALHQADRIFKGLEGANTSYEELLYILLAALL